MIREVLSKIVNDYLKEKKVSTKNNQLHKYIRKDVPEILSDVIGKDKLNDFHIKASGGEGNWRGVPWITILHKGVSLSRNTNNPEKNPPSAKWGFYPAYLFKGDMSKILFGLVQAETNVRKQYGKNVETILKSRAVILQDKLPEHQNYFDSNINIELFDNTFSEKMIKEAKRWIISAAFGKVYKSNKLPDEDTLSKDLLNMFNLFNKAIERGGVTEKIKFTETPKISLSTQKNILTKKDRPLVNSNKKNNTNNVKNKKSKKIDFISQNKKNEELGKFGEQLVIKYEEDKLKNNGHDLIKYPIIYVAEKDDTAGYDIKSYDKNNEVRYIEVKTTRDNSKAPFYISTTELEFGRDRENYYIYRLYKPEKNSEKWEFYEIKGKELDKLFILEPSGFKAKLK